MQFHEEIEKLQAQYDALAARVTALEPIVEQPEVLTAKYLDTLNPQDLFELARDRKIDSATLAEALVRTYDRYMPMRVWKPDVLDGQKYVVYNEPVTVHVEAIADAVAKTSGDDQDAGDWTKHGDGTAYPGAEQAGS